MICKECGEDKKHQARGLCQNCYSRLRYIKKRGKKDEDEINKRMDSLYKLNDLERKRFKKQTCDLITQHHEDLKDDPESLSTEFMQKLIGRECD